MLDRIMRSMNRYFFHGQHLHGSLRTTRHHCRAWALLYNFTPWNPTTTRANNGWRAMAALLKDGSVEFEMVWDTGDAGFTAIKDAYFNDSTIGLAIMDGDITTPGSQGLQANFEVMNFSRSEPLEDALKVNVTVKPAYSPSTPPAWVTISA